jgi:hypothetical protein
MHSTFLRHQLARLGVVALVAVGLAVPAGLLASPAMAMCRVDGVVYKTPYAGSRVWIPTSLAAGPYQRGGTQSVSYTDGSLYSKTHGSSDTVGGGGKVGWGWGEVSATYNHTWSRSTTYTTSHSRTYTTTSPTLSKKYSSRWTLYHLAWKFRVKQVVSYTNGCPNTHTWRTVAVPTRGWKMSKLDWQVQRAAHPHRWHPFR